MNIPFIVNLELSFLQF